MAHRVGSDRVRCTYLRTGLARHGMAWQTSYFPPNTPCNFLNFNETARGCTMHLDGQPMEFLVR